MKTNHYPKDRRVTGELDAKMDGDRLAVYQIRLKGHLDSQWAEWFGGLTVTLEENGDTLLAGPVVDQAALYGLLKKVRDLGMPLLSVNCLDLGRPDAAKDEPSNPIRENSPKMDGKEDE